MSGDIPEAKAASLRQDIRNAIDELKEAQTKWAGLADFSVVISLVLVAFGTWFAGMQVMQNTRSTKASTVISIYEQLHNWKTSNGIVWQEAYPQQCSQEDEDRVPKYESLFLIYEQAWLLNQQGLFQGDPWAKFDRSMCQYFPGWDNPCVQHALELRLTAGFFGKLERCIAESREESAQ